MFIVCGLTFRIDTISTYRLPIFAKILLVDIVVAFIILFNTLMCFLFIISCISIYIQKCLLYDITSLVVF